MAEQALEAYRYLRHLYRNPYCCCDLYEKDDKIYRTFQIQDTDLMRILAMQINKTSLDYSFYQGAFVLIVPWCQTISLQEYQKQQHPWKEVIALAEDLLFTLQHMALPEMMNLMFMDAYAIGVNEQKDVILWCNPNFSALKHMHSTCTLWQRCAELLAALLASSKEVKHFHQKPKAYCDFLMKLEKKQYQSAVELMLAVKNMEDCYVPKQHDYRKAGKIILYILILLLFCLLLALGVYYYLQWINQTYDGIDHIGGRNIVS